MSTKKKQPEPLPIPDAPPDLPGVPPDGQTAMPDNAAPPGETDMTPEEMEGFLTSCLSAAAELAELKNHHARLAAEYENFRRRTARERETLYKDAAADTAAKFLPVYDNLERALKQSTEDAAYARGVEMIMAGLMEILGKLDIQPIAAANDPFDPTVHDAVMHIDDEALGESVIAEVFSQGFMMGDKVIRHAMVKVAN